MDHPDVSVHYQAASSRRGLIADRRISAGAEIAVFDGVVSTWDTSTDVPNEAPEFLYEHSIQFHPFMCRDSRGFARYANHSCDPNCGIRDLFKIVAMRDIAPGEEITWDYAMAENDDWAMDCTCGAANCRGVVRGFRYLPLERRRDYSGFISGWHFDPYVSEKNAQQEAITLH